MEEINSPSLDHAIAIHLRSHHQHAHQFTTPDRLRAMDATSRSGRCITRQATTRPGTAGKHSKSLIVWRGPRTHASRSSYILLDCRLTGVSYRRAEQLMVPSEQHRIITHQSIRTGKLHTQDILTPTACWAVAVVILVIALVLIRIRATRVVRTPLP